VHQIHTTRAARLATIAAAVALASFAAPAEAAPKAPPARTPAAAAPTPAAARPAPAAAPTALRPAPPAAAVAPAVEDADDWSTGWRFGPALGLEFGMGDAKYDAVAFRLDAQREVRRLSPEATLSLLGVLSVAHASGKESVSIVVDPFLGRRITDSIEWDANVFELVPGGRITYAATPGLSLFVDGGLGLSYAVATARVPSSLDAFGVADPVDGGVGGVLRLAAGLAIAPSPNFRVVVQALGFNVRFGNGPGSSFDLALSLSTRL
jgi:hypothetical protein